MAARPISVNGIAVKSKKDLRNSGVRHHYSRHYNRKLSVPLLGLAGQTLGQVAAGAFAITLRPRNRACDKTTRRRFSKGGPGALQPGIMVSVEPPFGCLESAPGVLLVRGGVSLRAWLCVRPVRGIKEGCAEP